MNNRNLIASAISSIMALCSLWISLAGFTYFSRFKNSYLASSPFGLMKTGLYSKNTDNIVPLHFFLVRIVTLFIMSLLPSDYALSAE